MANISNPLSTIFNAGAAVANGLFGYIGQKQTNKLNKQLFDESKEFARENHDIERKEALADRAHEESYNSPLAQMTRLKAAGINPVDFMSEPVSTSTAQASAIDNPSAPSMQSGLPSLGGIGASFRDMQLSREIADAQIANINADTAEKQRNTAEGNETFAVRMESLKADLDNSKKTFEKMSQDINESLARTDLSKEQRHSLELANEFTTFAMDNNKEMSNLDVIAKRLDISKVQAEMDKWSKELEMAAKRLDLDSWMTAERIAEIRSAVASNDVRRAIDAFDLGIKEETRGEMITQIEASAQKALADSNLSTEQSKTFVTRYVVDTCVKSLGLSSVGAFLGKK